MKRIMFGAVLLGMVTVATAGDMYKCPPRKGDPTIIISNDPCPGGTLYYKAPSPPEPKTIKEKHLANRFQLFQEASKNIGMTKQEFLEKRRWPDKINTTTTLGATHEQYIYKFGNNDTEYYYFENDKLTAVQGDY